MFTRLFGQLYLALGANPLSRFLLKLFLQTRQRSASLERLNGFLAYLEPKAVCSEMCFLLALLFPKSSVAIEAGNRKSAFIELTSSKS